MDIEIKKADTFLEKLRGLMFRRKIDHGILFDLEEETRLGACIHSIFVFFKFDVIFLNSDKEIVDIRESVRPFKPLIIPKEPVKYILELPEGKIDEKGLNIGQSLKGRINL